MDLAATSRMPTGLFETVESVSFVIVGVKHGQQFCDYQEVLDLVCQVKQLELAAVAADGGVIRNQFTDTTGIDVFDATQIEQNLLLAAVDQTSYGIS